MTKLITIPRFAEATGLPYRLCLHLMARARFRPFLSDAADGSMCAGWTNGWQAADMIQTEGAAAQPGLNENIRSNRRC